MKICLQFSTIVAGLALGMLFSGCIGSTVEQTVYMQSLDVTGPMAQPPLHLNKDVRAGQFTISPRMAVHDTKSITGRLEGHTMVDEQGRYRVDTMRNSSGQTIGFADAGYNRYLYAGQNLRWKIPGNSYGMDVGFMVSNVVGLSGGMTYAPDNQGGYWGGNLGLGLAFGGSALAGRVDGGVLFQSITFEATSVVVTHTSAGLFTDSSTTIDFFRDSRTETTMGYYGTFLLNTVFDAPVNGFVQVGITSQKLDDYTPTSSQYTGPFFQYNYNDTRTSNAAVFFIVTPGLFFDLGNGARLLTGVRLFEETAINNISPQWTVVPMAQMDFAL